MKKLILFFGLIFLISVYAKAQSVGISSSGSFTPDASAGLDVSFTDKGILIPRVALTGTNDASTISNPATSLVVYNDGTGGLTPAGFYYNAGDASNPNWVKLFDDNQGHPWLLEGNAGTTPGTDFLGTTDAVDLVLKANNTEQARILSYSDTGGIGLPNGLYALWGRNNAGNKWIRAILPAYTDDDIYIGSGANPTGTNIHFDVGAKPDAIFIEGSSGKVGVWTTAPLYPLSVVSGDQDAVGYFQSTQTYSDDWPVYGICANTDFWGYGGYFRGGYKGVQGTVYPSGSYYYYGVYGYVYGGSGTNYGSYASAYGSGTNYGSYGYASSSSSGNAYGVYGNAYGDNGKARGVYGRADGQGNYGGYFFNGHENGEGLNVIGENLSSYYYLTYGCGAGINGDSIGVYGRGNHSGDDVWGGYFEDGNGTFTYIGGTYSGTAYKVNGNGNVATIVKDTKGDRVSLFAPEAPEILFQDYGEGQLVNGKAHIKIDPILAKNITVDKEHPLRVFIQLEGESNGVYVTNKTAEGFDVVELNNGRSNVKFTWFIVANRANEYNEKGELVSKNLVRFPLAPGPRKAQKVDIPKEEREPMLNKNKDPKQFDFIKKEKEIMEKMKKVKK